MTIYPFKLYILPALVVVLFSLAYFPAFELLAQKWLASDDYTHAFFIVPAIGYMIWLKRPQLSKNAQGSNLGIIFVVVSIVLYYFSLQLQVPTFIFIATVASIVSGIMYIYGFKTLRVLIIPLVLLIMIIPIPNQILSTITASLQLRISEISEIILRSFSIPMLREGNLLHIQNKSFQVVEACSGIRSLISLTTMSILISYFTLSRLRSAALLFLFSIPVAIIINILRVVTLVLAYYYFQLDLSEGMLHTLTGLFLFILGLGLIYIFQKILELWEIKNKIN